MDYLIYNLADSHLPRLADVTLLSEAEREAAATRGERYVLTRCLLRHELARRLGGTPQSIRFRIGAQGKPECEGIHFNISHSGDCFAMVFDRENPVGIDVERMRPRARLEALAARIMNAEQLAAFRARGCKEAEFYSCWCAAEALVKQAGCSIWQAQQFPWHYEAGRIRLAEDCGLALRLFTPMPGYAGAVVYKSPQPGLSQAAGT